MVSDAIYAELAAAPGVNVTVDLEGCQLKSDAGLRAPFQVEAFARACLIEGRPFQLAPWLRVRHRCLRGA